MNSLSTTINLIEVQQSQTIIDYVAKGILRPQNGLRMTGGKGFGAWISASMARFAMARGHHGARSFTFVIYQEPGRPPFALFAKGGLHNLREHREEVAQIGLIGGISKQRSYAEDFFERPQG